MKKSISILILFTILTSSVLFGCKKENTTIIDYIINENDTINIGVIVPQSGDYKEYGENVLAGIEYAHTLAPQVQIDKNYNLNLITEDTESDLPTVADKMINNKVAAIICAGTNKEKTDLIINQFASTAIPLIFVDNHSELITNTEKVFSISISTDYQVSVATSHFIEKSYRNGAIILADDSEYSSLFAQKFQDTFTSNGGESVSTYYFSGDSENFRANAIAGAGLDFAFVVGDSLTQKKIHTQLIGGGFASEIMFSEVFEKTILEAEDFNGISFISSFEPDDLNNTGTVFLDSYSTQSKINESDINASTAYGHDAYMTLYTSLCPNDDPLGMFKNNEESSESTESSITTTQLKDKIKAVEYYGGVTDTIIFDSNGTVKPTFLYINNIENSNSVMLNRYDYNYEQN